MYIEQYVHINIMSIKLRKHQKECVKGIEEAFEDSDKCLVKMFCGSGKTRIVFYLMMTNEYTLSVIVFPSIALITQFNKDYIYNDEWKELTEEYNYISICSKNELKEHTYGIKYTTNPKYITKFIQRKEMKIIAVTYQSLELFVKCLLDTDCNVDQVVYDEAHHIIGDTIQKIVFENEDFVSRIKQTIFMTATPKNDNGITMLDRSYNVDDTESEQDYYSDCGVLAYEYTHYQAVEDGICNDFDIAIDLYTDNDGKYDSIYQAIFRSVFTTHNNRVLTFHYRSETEHDTKSDVLNFVDNVDKIKKEFNRVLKEEFPELKKKYSYDKFVVNGITGKTRNRIDILDEFDETPKHSVSVLSSCNTIGEGVDTKNANQIVFVDARTSYATIIQNIGRCCRKPHGKDIPKATILIPCYVDANKYKDCKTQEERDVVIREDMMKTGNFNSILNVLSALRQEDPELYDLCLGYPNKYSHKEVKKNLSIQGYTVEESKGDLYDNICYLEGCNKKKIDGKDIADVGKKLEKCIKVHSLSMEEPIKSYNKEDKSNGKIRLYYDGETYSPIVKTNEKASKKIKPCKRKPFKINVHTNPDVKVLWGIEGDIDLTGKICQGYIGCTVKKDVFEETYNELVKWVDENGRIPSNHSIDKIEQRLGMFCSHKRDNYKNDKLSVHRINKLEEINGWYWKKDDPFYDKCDKLKQWLKKNNKLPNIHSKDKFEHMLGKWSSRQRYNMRNNLLTQDKIDLLNQIKQWYWEKDDNFDDMYDTLIKYISDNEKLPPLNSNNENRLATWCSEQRKKYKKNKLSKDKISKLNKINIWTWNKFDDLFEQHYQNVIEWVNKNGKIPSSMSKDKIEHLLGSWCGSRRNDKRNGKLPDDKIEKLEKIKGWYWDKISFDDTHNKVYDWVKHHNKIPTNKSRDPIERDLGNWCKNRRTDKRNGILDNNQIKKIELIPNWFWDKDELFDITYIKLKKWANDSDKIPTPISKDTYERELGIWCNSRRQDKKVGRLTKERIGKLEQLPNWFWDWDKQFDNNYQQLFEFVSTEDRIPSTNAINAIEKKLGGWCSRIRNYMRNGKLDDIKIKRMEKIDGWYWEKNYFDDNYHNLLEWVNISDRLPSHHSKDSIEKSLGSLCCQFRLSRKKNKLSQDKIEKLEQIPHWYWEAGKPVKKSITEQPKQTKTSKEKTGKSSPKSQLSELHKEYKTLKSTNLHKKFKDNPELWHTYHKIAEENEASFEEHDEIPYRQIIRYLEGLKISRKKYIVDMGCGKARIYQHFKDNKKFKFYNYDHYSCDKYVESCDISETPHEENEMNIAILCLAMWGSNCKDYIKEAYRILEQYGTLLIIEPSKRWIEEYETNRLIKWLEENNMFKIRKIHSQNKFMFIEAVRN